MHPLAATGERTVPGARHEEYWFARHDVAYRWIAEHFLHSNATNFRQPMSIVDAGSGEGWGPSLLANTGPHLVTCLEYDAATADHCSTTYPSLRTIRCNLAHLPLRPRSVDLLVSLQVIEHLWSLPQFLIDCAAVLATDGQAIFTTPNRPVFSPGLQRGQAPTNPFHVEEFDADQLHDLLDHAGFTDIAIGGITHGPRLTSWEATNGSIIEQLIALASAQPTAAPIHDTPTALEDFLPTITATDFVLCTDNSMPTEAPWQDLVATARAPR